MVGGRHAGPGHQSVAQVRLGGHRATAAGGGLRHKGPAPGAGYLGRGVWAGPVEGGGGLLPGAGHCYGLPGQPERHPLRGQHL